LVSTIGLSLVANGLSGGALPAIGDFSTSAMLMVLCFLNLTSLRRLKIACGVIAASVVVLAVLGIYSYHTGWMARELVLRQAVSDDSTFEGTVLESIPALDTSGRFLWRVRSLGFLHDPNDFAQALVMVVPLVWWARAVGHRLRNLLVVMLPTAIIGYCLYLTHSRGALLGVASMFVFGLQRALGLPRTVILLAVVVAGAQLGGFGGGREMGSGEQSAGERIDAWGDGLNMVRARPLLGVGYGRFTEHHERTAHNSFVLCFSELGLVGYFIWIAMIVVAYQGLALAIRDPAVGDAERGAAVYLRSSLVAFLTCAWFLSRTYQPGLYVLLALCVSAWHCAMFSRPANAPPAAAVEWGRTTLSVMVVTVAAVYAFALSHNVSR
jgi:hypothetical protein